MPIILRDADLIISALSALINEIYSPDKLDVKAYLSGRVSAEVFNFVKFFLDADSMSFDDFCRLQNDEPVRVLRRMIDYLRNLTVVKLEMPCEFDSSVISKIHFGLAEIIGIGAVGRLDGENASLDSSPGLGMTRESASRLDLGVGSTGIVLDIKYNADILGGLVITYAGKHFDYSIKSAVYSSFYGEKGEPLIKI